MKTSSELIMEYGERGEDAQVLIDALVEKTEGYTFNGQQLVAASTDAVMEVVELMGTLLGGLIQAVGGTVSADDLGGQLVNTFRIAMAASLYDQATSVVEADVIEEG